MQEFLQYLHMRISKRINTQILVLNTNKLYMMKNDAELCELIMNADLIASEFAIFWGAKKIGTPIKSTIRGISLMKEIIKYGVRHDFKFYFIGSNDDILKRMISNLYILYPSLNIVGKRTGFFSDELDVVSQIAKSKADVLFCAMGSPKQELFLDKFKNDLGIPVTIGVGGSFDVLAGEYSEAPDWMRNGFEWIYRTIQNPKILIRRYAVINTYFIYRLLKYMIFHK